MLDIRFNVKGLYITFFSYFFGVYPVHRIFPCGFLFFGDSKKTQTAGLQKNPENLETILSLGVFFFPLDKITNTRHLEFPNRKTFFTSYFVEKLTNTLHFFKKKCQRATLTTEEVAALGYTGKPRPKAAVLPR